MPSYQSLATYLTLLAAICVPLGCGVAQDEYTAVVMERDALRDSVSVLKAEVEDLRNTPHERLARAQRQAEAGSEDQALQEYRALIERYPDAPETETATAAVTAIEQRLARERAEAERLRREGFRALPVERNVDLGGMSVSVNSVSLRDRWIMDRYDRSWHYTDATRGSTYVLADVTVSSDSHNPALPPLVLYVADGADLRYVGTLAYRFYRWDDYGSYLGNEADYGNDFSRTRSIRFSTGLEVKEDAVDDEAAFVLVGKRGCFHRERNEYGRPEVRYRERGCSTPPRLTAEGVAEAFHVVHVSNRNAL